MELLRGMIESNNAIQDEILALRDGVSLFLILSNDKDMAFDHQMKPVFLTEI